MSRRRLLGLFGAATAGGVALVAARRVGGGTTASAVGTAGTARLVETYADRGDATGEWWVPPAAGPLPTVVLVHGGYWRPGYDRSLEDPVAADLAGRGLLVWNVDYRSSADPWPSTLTDVAAAYDHLTRGAYADRVDSRRVAVVGHSAGGQLALWLASRQRLPAGAVGGQPPGPTPALAVGQAPVACLALAARQRLGGGAAQALTGGSPDDVPERYAVADPLALLPTGVRTVLVHGPADGTVPIDQSECYQAAGGAGTSLERVPGDHFAHLDPGSVAVERLRAALATM